MIFEQQKEQLYKWQAGEPVHSAEHGCCPDYSCCNSLLLASVSLRDRFVAACERHDVWTVHAIKMMFFSAAYPHIYVIGFYYV